MEAQLSGAEVRVSSDELITRMDGGP
jgi:hypothetical protein